MKVVRVTGTQAHPQTVLDDAPVPTPADGELLIRVGAAGLMPTELLWDPTWRTPSGESRVGAVPGHEFSGAVAAFGAGVRAFKIGQAVFGMNAWTADGAMAEFTTAPVSAVTAKPSALTHVQAASVPIGALTAWQALFDHARLAAGESALIHGGAGSVGHFAVQFAHAHGARVTATVSAANLNFVTTLGADEAVDYRHTPLENLGPRFDVIFDTVGGETLDRSWGLLKPQGRLVTVASSSSNMEPRVQSAFFIVKPNQQQLSDIAAQLESGSLRTVVDAVVPLSQAPGAYSGNVARAGRGKVVVSVTEE